MEGLTLRVPRIDPRLTLEAADAAHKETCVNLIQTHGYRRVLDVGGGRAPLFTLEEISALGLDYTVIDVDSGELAMLPSGYSTIVGDICDAGATSRAGGFDLVLSKMVAEHVPDGEAMHRNVFHLLRPGGRAFHFFPTLYSPVFVANWIVPEWLSSRVFRVISNRTAPKFPAVYSWCRGPTNAQMRRLQRIGWEVELYRAFYGTDYMGRIPVVGVVESLVSAWAAKRQNALLASYAFLVTARPV